MRIRPAPSDDGEPTASPDERGSSAVEAVVVVPVAMLVVLVAVQACLWARATAMVQTAAAEGDQAACDLGGSMSSGIGRAQQFLASAASGSVTSPAVSGSVPVAGQVEIQVHATAEAIIPWLHLTVSASRRGDVQGFRSGE